MIDHFEGAGVFKGDCIHTKVWEVLNTWR